MTAKQIRVGVSPITNQIFVGYVNKKGDAWTTKQDATTEILFAVAQHAMEFGKPIILSEETADGRFAKKYSITVEQIGGEE
ncbi:TPA: hypothetical protein ACPI87_000313 [Haemophilus influenzae]|uniref:Uncharacterized protein n=2 Tax=Haemophilus influenzae TaxID=727 RepID=A0A2S9RPP0_HAEIF|nr:hypothetical protein [Haemophilus influenzae]AWP53651.1 hypothetical protein DLJ98_02260 [Haemophilus influenzae]AWP54611.1 hypothetical protein DLJ98_08985 [Haemophilus influenzae]PRI36388.1 hypothetical protein BVZ56_00346 [Haemophilus influenzae]PRI37473.1 hypothetical protein BVZ56_00287 [Haemophilus influenzae]PRI40792.1 hypothetical protein BVZ56_01365 [Haemophilus influenzae]